MKYRIIFPIWTSTNAGLSFGRVPASYTLEYVIKLPFKIPFGRGPSPPYNTPAYISVAVLWLQEYMDKRTDIVKSTLKLILSLWVGVTIYSVPLCGVEYKKHKKYVNKYLLYNFLSCSPLYQYEWEIAENTSNINLKKYIQRKIIYQHKLWVIATFSIQM